MRRYACDLTILFRVFTIDKKLPTITEIADVTDLFDEPSLMNDSTIDKGAPSKVDLEKTSEMILRSVSFADSSPDPVEHLRFLGEESSDYRPPNLDDDFKILTGANVVEFLNSRDVLMTCVRPTLMPSSLMVVVMSTVWGKVHMNSMMLIRDL